MTEEQIKILEYVGTAILAITIWFKDAIAIRVGIKKDKKDLEGSSLANLQKNLDIYQEMIEFSDIQYKTRIVEFENNFNTTINRLKADLEQLKEINEKLKLFIDEQKVIITKQNKSLTYYRNKYGESQ